MGKKGNPRPEAMVEFMEEVARAHVKHIRAIAHIEEKTGLPASILLNLAESDEFNKAVDKLPPAEAGRILKLLVLLNRSGGEPEEFLKKPAKERQEMAKEIEKELNRRSRAEKS